MSSAPAFELDQIRVTFGGVVALDDASLSVERGEICGLIGANGAGKTTLFDVASGIRTPTAGRIRLDRRDVTRWRAHRMARAGLRRTFQRVQIFGWLTVEENLLVATEWRGGGGGVLADLAGAPTRRGREAQRRERAADVLDRCGLGDIRHRSAGTLPIGTARLVELGRALIDDPTVLLLDEPASGLSAAESERFAAIVDDTRQRLGTAVLLVEHDVGFVMEHCDRVAALHLGRIIANGLPAEVRDDPAVREAYLGAAS